MSDSPQSRPVTACLVIIGNEILSGRTQDANLAYIATGLNSVGIQLREVRVIPDVADTIVDTLNDMRHRFDYVFTTGGIGPTHDDITAENVARAFDVDLVLDPEAKRRLQALYDARGIEMNEARLRMAHVPQGATLIDNPVSAAPGFQIGNVFVMAGVPKVAQAMFESIKDRLTGGRTVLSRTITCDLAEGTIAKALGAIQQDFPEIDIGSYPFWTATGFGANLVLRGPDPDRLAVATDAVSAMVTALGGHPTEPPA